MDILQLAVQQLLTTNDNVTAANIAFPKAFCSYDEQTPDDPSSYVVVPYDPQLCSIVQVCVRIKTPTSPFYPDGHHAITIQYYDRDATQPPRATEPYILSNKLRPALNPLHTSTPHTELIRACAATCGCGIPLSSPLSTLPRVGTLSEGHKVGASQNQ